MKTKYLIILICIVFSCNSIDTKLYEIDPRTFSENKITLADIADDIQYIPLDNNYPLIPNKYVITPNSIYVSARNTGILKYDKKGKFLKRIGRKGKGPDEFLTGYCFTIDEKSGNIFVIDNLGETLVYSQDGAFLRRIPLDDLGNGVGFGKDIELFNSYLFYPNSLAFGSSKYNWAFLDTLGNTTALKENTLEPFDTDADGAGVGIYKFDNKIYYYNYFIDTVFSISSDLSYKPEYLLAEGDFRWPRKPHEVSNSVDDILLHFSKLFHFRMFETNRFLVLDYSYNKRNAIAFIEKKTKEVFLAYERNEDPNPLDLSRTIPCINNDLDGGLPLEDLEYYSENDQEYITTFIEPVNLKLYIESNDFKNSTPKYPEKKKELEKLANSLDENDNPVLMLVKLKE